MTRTETISHCQVEVPLFEEPAAISEIIEHFPSAAEGTRVTDAMVSSVISVDPDMEIARLIRIFVEHGISGAPVVDTEGRPLGIVSKSDVIRALAENLSGTALAATFEPIARRRVRDIMMPLVIFVGEDVSIARAAAVMAYEQIHRVLVVDQTRKVVGIVSSIDVLAWLARNDGFVVP